LEPENIEGLLTVMIADAFGRPPMPKTLPATVKSIAAKAEELAVRTRAPEPLIMGRDLVSLGFPPGRELGQVLEHAYDAQLAGEFFDRDGGLIWLAQKARVVIPPKVREAIESNHRS